MCYTCQAETKGVHAMHLWSEWWSCVKQLRPAFSRERTFLWFAAAVAAACIRPDLAGVTSFVRALGLGQACYTAFLVMFHSTGADPERVAAFWTQTVLTRMDPLLLRSGGRTVFLADGITVAKAGQKIPTVNSRFLLSADSWCSFLTAGIFRPALATVV